MTSSELIISKISTPYDLRRDLDLRLDLLLRRRPPLVVKETLRP
jgi:hypothetical protein